MSNKAPKPARCSNAMARVLLNLYTGKNPWVHLSGRSMYGGANSTLWGLMRRGWVEQFEGGLRLTEAGREQAAGLTGL